ARARQWSARCYGVARQRDGSRQNSTGPALIPFVTLSRARSRQWSARCYGVARQRDGSRQNSTGPRVNPSCHPYAREGQAVVCPLLRGSSPTRWVAPKQHRGLRRSFPLSLGAWVPKNLARRSFGLLVSAARCCSTGSGRLDLDLLISGPRVNLFYHPWRVGAEESGAA